MEYGTQGHSHRAAGQAGVGEHFSVAILGNHGALKARQLAQQVADLYLGDAQPDAPAAAIPETIELEEAQLSAKAGRYYNADTSAFIDIEFNDGTLQILGYDLAPVSRHNFIFAAFPEASASFSPATATGPAQVLVDTDTGRTRYAWAESVVPTPDSLRAYTGRYYSPELDVYWTITLRWRQPCCTAQETGPQSLDAHDRRCLLRRLDRTHTTFRGQTYDAGI